MAGMLQIITYLLSFYLAMKGVEILQIALASTREDRAGIITIGVVALIVCIAAGFYFSSMQDQQAQAMQPSSQEAPSG
jgi:hypothetical protein